MQLTEHFTLEEFTHSDTAQRLGIDNSIPSPLIPNLSALCQNILEPLRQQFNVPIIISSGYRCPELNKAVGGAPNSQHLTGEAADIHLNSTDEGREWFRWIMDNLEFDQLIWEVRQSQSRWIHVSYREDNNRQQVLRSLIKR